MRSFLVLAALLIGAGLTIALYFPGHFSLGGWVSGSILLIFAAVGHAEMRRGA